jgi:hypothetical protein
MAKSKSFTTATRRHGDTAKTIDHVQAIALRSVAVRAVSPW